MPEIEFCNKHRIWLIWGVSRGRVQGVSTPLRWSFLLRKYVFALKSFLPHRQWRHSLEVHPLLRKILDPPLLSIQWVSEFVEVAHEINLCACVCCQLVACDSAGSVSKYQWNSKHKLGRFILSCQWRFGHFLAIVRARSNRPITPIHLS